MTVGPRTLAITESFYAWELRGRGWTVAPYPVVLEPPFRYPALLPSAASLAEPIDDGRRPTFLSQLVETLTGSHLSAGSSASEIQDFEEPEPHACDIDDELVCFELRVPEEHGSSQEVTEQLLRALSSSMAPVSFETVATAGRVKLQVTCRSIDRALVLASLEGYCPDVSVIESEDQLRGNWQEGKPSATVDFGLSEEFFLPLRTFPSLRVDPYIPLIAGLAEADVDEVAALQILFERVCNPWDKALGLALVDDRGECVFGDAPDFLPLSREKLRSPLFAGVVRAGACAKNRARAMELVRGIGPFVLQFERMGANSFIPLENADYPDELHREAFLSRTSYRSGMLLSAEELAGLVHLPDASLRHPALERETVRTKRAPPAAMGHDYVLGTNVHRGEVNAVSLGETSRLQHVHLLGASGTGKSTLLLDLITQDIRAGRGIAVLDPHGDLIEDILARVPEDVVPKVVLFDPSDEEFPIGLNVLSARSAIERQLLASDLVSVFQRLSTSWGDSMGAVLANAILAILEHPTGGTLVDLRRFLVDDEFRRQFLRDIPDEEVQLFWTKGFSLIGTRSIGPILTRLDSFLRPKLIRHIVGQKAPRLDLGAVLEGGQIFLGKLSQGLIGAENASLLGSLIATRLHQLAMARQGIARLERRPFYLYADEAQYFVTPSMASLLTDVRKYRFGLVLAHQNLFQIRGTPVESALLGNAYTRIAFRVGDEDSKKLAEGCSFFEARDFRSLGVGAAIARVGSSQHDFNLKTRPLSPVPPDEAMERRRAVLHASRAAFAVPLDDLRSAPGIRKPDESGSARVEPETVPSPSLAKEARASRREHQAAAPVRESPKLGRGGQAHKYLQHLVKRLAEERGFRAVIEAPVAGGQIDIALYRDTLSIAVEVSITTDVDHERANLEKCHAGGFEHVVLIAQDARRAAQYRRALAEVIELRAVRVLEPSDLAEFLDAFEPEPGLPEEQTVRGYKVRVSRQSFTPEEAAKRRQAVARTIAKSLGRRE